MKTTARHALALLTFIAAPALAEAPEIAKVREAFQTLTRGETPEGIRASGVPGIYEVRVGAQVFYMTGDGRHMFTGDLYDVQRRANLTEEARGGLRVSALAAVPEDRMIIFGPKKARHTLTVFTDIDCGYCQRLHLEMDELNKAGIRVRYLFYPRAGVGSESYVKAVSVWCAKDRQQAMTDAKAGRPVPRKTCDNPVSDHMALGDQLGVRGTPSMVTDRGEWIPGYQPAAMLAQALEDGRAARP